MIKNREDYVQDVVNGGNFLIERAEDIIGNIDDCYGIEIKLRLYPHEVPTISIEKNYHNYKEELINGNFNEM